MTQSTYFIQVKNVLKVLQGYTKGIRFIALLTMLCTIGVGQMWGADVVYKTAKFGSSYNSMSVSSYTNSWSATNNSFTVNLTNANNNNGWSYIKIGRKNNASIGTITTNNAIDKAVTKVTLTIDAFTATKINSITLYTSTSRSGSYTSVGTFTKEKGTQSVTLTTPTANLFYKIAVDCASGSSNGLITISQVDYYIESTTSVDPTATFSDGEYTVGGAALDLSTLWESNSTGAVTYSVKTDGSTGASINGTSFTATAAGSCTVLASQAAATGYNAITKEATITVNAAQGGGDPETPGTGGEELSYTWDLSKKTYSAASDTQVTWSATDVNMVADKGNAGTNPNNYLGGDANNRTSSRFYQNSILTITPSANVTITSVVFTATSESYATALKESTWTNASASVSSKTVTVTPTNGASAISAKIGGTCGFTGVTVHYTKAAFGEPEPVIVKTLKSIAVTGMKTTYEQGDTFKFDGTCTATYSVTKDDVAQADETVDVTPTSVSTPDMNQVGTQTITVTYETVSTTYDITITENEVTAGTYDVLLNNVLWNVTAGQQAASVESMAGKSNDITFYTTKGSSQMYASATQTRFYASSNLVISVPAGYVIKSITFTEPTSDKNWEGSITVNTGTYTDGTKSWSGSAQEVQFSFAAHNRIANASITYEALDLTLPAAPTFTPAAGTYNAAQNVTISAEAGTTIHYTLDGTDPTTESNVYSTPIEIAETKTLKAIAVKDEKVSPIASAKYTINLPLTTMDQIFDKATAVGGTATSVEITFGNWVVSAVKEDGRTAFVTDGTKGFAIFDKDVNLGFSVGNILSGTVACEVELYNGFAELTGLTSSTTGLTVSTGGTITTQELDAAGIDALTGVNTGSLIKINGTCTSESSKYYVAGVQIYTSLYDFGTLEVGTEYNITGIYQQFHSTKEMLPRSAEDIEEVVGLPTATISIADITMEVGETKTIEATITPDAAQSTVQYAITSGSEFITLNGTTITAVAAGTATITATIAEKADEYKGATKEFTVTVKPQNIAVLPFAFDSGKDDIENTLGMSQNGLGSDYGSAPKLKFNDAGDNVIVHFDCQAGEFSFLLKQNGQNAGTFTVYESANGEDYTPVWSGGDFGNAQSETIKPTLSESARYVKFEYTTKGNSTNYALGSISIAKPDLRQEAGIAWSTESVEITVGDAFTAPTLSNPNGLTLTCTSTNEELATVTNAGVITLQSGVTGTAAITASFAGNEDYNAAEVSCTIIVTDVAAVYTVTWYVNGMQVHTQQVGAGDEVTPPEVNSIPCGDVLAGWTDAENGNYVHGTSTLHEGAQPSIEVAEDKTFYAVFADYE